MTIDFRMTFSNRLTILRGIAALAFVPIIAIDSPFARVFAILIYTLAAITDYYDGRLARLAKEKTDFGVIADPIADKLLVAVCLIAISLIDGRLVPMWMTVVILAREIGITAYRFKALSAGRVLAAEKLGKWKTGLQMTLIPCALVVITVFTGPDGRGWEELLARRGWLGAIIAPVYWLSVLTTILTIYSGISFLVKNMKSSNAVVDVSES